MLIVSCFPLKATHDWNILKTIWEACKPLQFVAIPEWFASGVPETWGATNCLCLRFSDQRLNEHVKHNSPVDDESRVDGSSYCRCFFLLLYYVRFALGFRVQLLPHQEAWQWMILWYPILMAYCETTQNSIGWSNASEKSEARFFFYEGKIWPTVNEKVPGLNWQDRSYRSLNRRLFSPSWSRGCFEICARQNGKVEMVLNLFVCSVASGSNTSNTNIQRDSMFRAFSWKL